jgi:holo-[acyl-carrier protein] synthase
VLAQFAAAARAALDAGLGVNAGHDLSRENLTDFLRAVPGVQEVSIGHALISDALELGYSATVKAYLQCIPRCLRRCMIYGVGTDICDVRRIRASLARHGDRFARKILSDAELATWRARSARWPERGIRYLATRFSAKEAFSKAIGLGMRMPMSWRLCEMGKLPSGKPAIVLHGGLKEWFEAQGLSAHVSVTDETDYAASFVVVEQKDA